MYKDAVLGAEYRETRSPSARAIQCGRTVTAASPAVSFEFALRNRLGYSWALTVFESAVIVSLILIFSFGPERRGKSFQPENSELEAVAVSERRA